MLYIITWAGTILGHGASWSLVIAKIQAGSGWELVTPCARSVVADIHLPMPSLWCQALLVLVDMTGAVPRLSLDLRCYLLEQFLELHGVFPRLG